jgi:hypothetical protein
MIKMSVALAVAMCATATGGVSVAKADPGCGRGSYSYQRSYYYRSGCDAPRSYYQYRSYREYEPSYRRGGYGFSISVNRGYRDDCYRSAPRYYRRHCD